MRRLLLLVPYLLLSLSALGQVFNSVQDGPWDDPDTWGAATFPTATTAGAITVDQNVTITAAAFPLGSPLIIDQTTIATGGTLTVEAGAELNFNSGAGNELTITGSGVWIVDGRVESPAGAVGYSGMTSANTFFTNTAEYQVKGTTVTIPPGDYDPASLIEITGLTTGTATANWNRPLGIIVYDCQTQSGAVSFAGNLTDIQSLTVLSTNDNFLRLATTQNYTLDVAGDIDVSGDSRFFFASSGTATVNLGGDYNFASTSASSSGLCSTACASVLNVNGGNFDMASGLFTVCTGTGTAAINLTDGGLTVFSPGLFNRAGTGVSNLNFVSAIAGTQDLLFEPGTLGTGNFSLTVNTAGEVLLGGALTFGGGLNLTAGTLNLDGNDLTVNGAVTRVSADIDATAPVNFTIGGVGALPADLVFSGGGLFTTFTMNRAGATLVTSSDMDVTTLNLFDGTLTCNGTLTMADGGLIDRRGDSGGSGILSNVPAAAGTYDLSYTVTGAAIVLQPGNEMPTAGSGFLRNLTKLGTGDLQLTQDLEVTNDITHSAGEFLTNGNDVEVAGNMSWSAASTLTGSTFTFSGNTTLSGSTAPVFTNVVVSGAFTPSLSHTLNGNLDVTGAWNQGTATTTFTSAGTSTITSTGGTITFNNLTISTSRTVIFPPEVITINGNLSVTATLDATTNNGTTLFGGTLQSFTGAGIKTFQDLAVAATSSLTCGISFTVDGVLNNDGTLSLTGGTKTLNGDISNNGTITSSAGTVAINSPGVDLLGTGSTAFFDLDLNAGSTFTTALDITINDDLIADGDFTSSGLVTIAGNCTMTGTGTKVFADITLGAASTFTPNSAYTVQGDITVPGGATYNGGNNTVTFDGTTTLIGNVNFNTAVINTTRSLDCGSGTVSVALTMTNNGTLDAASSVLTMTGAFTNAGTFSASPSVTLGGNFINDGTFVHNSGTITFAVTGAQKQLQGSQPITFYNLTVLDNGAATDVLNANTNGVDLLNVLTLGASGVLDADGATNNVFTLRSSGDDPTVDGGVATLPAGASVTGNVTVERYMALEGPASSNQIWRYISSPVNGATVADIQNELPVTGTFTGATGGLTTNPSMFTYDETETTDTDGDLINTMDDGFESFPLAINTETLTQGRGYVLFIFGAYPPLNGQANTLWNVRAPINSGNINLPVSYTSTGVNEYDGWNLVGNPYPATLDWDAAWASSTNVHQTINMIDYSNPMPVYATYDASTGIGVNGGGRYIAMGQAFWVKAQAAAPALPVTEAMKVAGQSTTFFRTSGPSDLLRIALIKGSDRDETVIHFHEGATLGFDSDLDSRKLRNPYWYLNLSSLASSGEKLVISSVPLGTCDMEVSLDVSDVPSGNYQLSFSEFESLSPALAITLTDQYTSTQVNVRTIGTYNFSVSAGNPATYGSGRFKVRFDMDETPPALLVEGPVACQPSDNLGVTVSGSRSDYLYELKSLSGTTVVEAIQGNGSDMTLLVPATALSEGSNSFKVVAASRYCSAANTESTVEFDYSALTAAPVSESASTCEPGTITLNATGAPATGSYRWYEELTGGDPISSSASFQTPVLSESRLYYVSTVNSLGCESTRIEVQANVIFTIPALVEIVGDTALRSNYSEGNQWLLNGTPINGATGQYLALGEESGLYTVEITGSGCTITDDLQYVVTGVEASSFAVKGVRIYPNPVRDMLVVEAISSDLVTGEFLSVSGARIHRLEWQQEGEKHKASLDVSQEAAGVYLVKVTKGSESVILRVIKR